MKFIIFILSLCLTTTAFSQDMKQLVSKNLGRRAHDLPRLSVPDYKSLQKAAVEGDRDAQKQLFSVIADHFNDVYDSVKKNDSLLFSLRRMDKGVYDAPSNNYAENIEALFKMTTDKISLEKENLTVTTVDGKTEQIHRIKYDDKAQTIKVTRGDNEYAELPLDSLVEKDRAFITNALIDDAFDSDLELSVEDSDEIEIENPAEGRNLISTTTENLTRRIIIKNESGFPLHNLLVEYQSFLEQSLLDYSKDMPEDYALVGYKRIDSIGPDSETEILVPLPDILQERTESFDDGNYTYYHKSPPGTHTRSEGDIGGTWVKVHRITPYGEHLEISKKFKAGSKKWNNVVPLSMKFD